MLRQVAFGQLMLLVLLAVPSWADDEFSFDEPMYTDPVIKLAPLENRFPTGLVPLWFKALEQDEAELQRLAAEAVTRAHSLGMKGLETTLPLLRKNFIAERGDLPMRLATARALLQMEDKPSYPSLLEACEKGGLEFALTIEPKLGELGYGAIRAYWLKRTRSDRTSSVRAKIAINGLATLQAEEAGPSLIAIVSDRRRTAGVRLAAARAVGVIGTSIDIGLLKRLADPKSSFLDRYMAAAMASVKQKDSAEVLRGLALDKNSAVARTALQRMLDRDSKSISMVADSLATSRDSRARMYASWGWEALPSETSVSKLCSQLSDPNTGVRQNARQILVRLAKDAKWKRLVVESATPVFAAKSWQGLEQATILFGQLGEKSRHKEMISLLEHPHSEVYIAAAWALRTLRAKEALPAMLKRVIRIQLQQVKSNGFRLDDQVSHIFQAFGVMKYSAGQSVLEEFMANKADYDGRVRAAAVWALGHITANSNDVAAKTRMAKKFVARMNDVAPVPPEDAIVKRFAAQGLARLNLPGTSPTVRDWFYRTNKDSIFSAACRWAYQSLTGQELEEPGPRIKVISGWFLEPVR